MKASHIEAHIIDKFTTLYGIVIETTETNLQTVKSTAQALLTVHFQNPKIQVTDILEMEPNKYICSAYQSVLNPLDCELRDKIYLFLYEYCSINPEEAEHIATRNLPILIEALERQKKTNWLIYNSDDQEFYISRTPCKQELNNLEYYTLPLLSNNQRVIIIID